MPYAYPLAILREANTGPLSASFFSESSAIDPGVDSSANTGRFRLHGQTLSRASLRGRIQPRKGPAFSPLWAAGPVASAA